MHNFGGKKDLDDSTFSGDPPSHSEATAIPTIVVTNVYAPPLDRMSTFDDIDEDEIFICDLMAMHPNDEDLVVEDLEEAGETISLAETEIENIPEAEEAIEDAVRNKWCHAVEFHPIALFRSPFQPSLLPAFFSFPYFAPK